MRTGHSACSTSSAVSTIDQLTDEDMTKYTVKVGIVVVDIAEINIVDIVDIDVDIVDIVDGEIGDVDKAQEDEGRETIEMA